MKKEQKQQKAKLNLEDLEIESFKMAKNVTGGHGCWSEAHTSCAGGGPC